MTIFDITIFWIHIAPSYYWLMYAIWFLAGYQYFAKKNIVSKSELEDLFFYVFLWVVLGWRIGYILFYDLWFYIENPLSILKVWQWWMSFHGGFLWVVFATLVFCKKRNISFWKIIDELAVIVCVGIWAGRIGNYLNKELLWYSWYNGPFAVEKWGIMYFPSPLLESFLEWLVLCVILYFINKYKKFYGKTSAFFLIGYGFFRTFIELFIRTPDSQIWYIAWFFTMGSILSLPMILFGIYLLFALRKNEINT